MIDLRLFIVEDEEIVLTGLTKALSREVNEVFPFSNPIEALEQFETIRPDIIITDIRMPRMSGIELVGKIREVAPDIPVIIASAFSETSYFLEAIRLKVDSFIIKPIDLDDLFGTLKKIETRLITERTVKKMKSAHQIANLGVWEYDLTKESLTWSDEIYDIFGLDKETFNPTYEKFVELIHPDDRQMLDEAYRNSLTTKQKYTVIHRILTPTESVRYVEEDCETFYDEQGNPTHSIGTIYDITPLQELARSLENEKERYKTLLDVAADGIHVLDEEGRLVEFSHSFAQMLGYTMDEIRSMRIFDWDVEASKETLVRYLNLDHPDTVEIDTRQRKKDGSVINVHIITKSIELDGHRYTYASSRDVTRQTENDRKLHEYLDIINEYVIVSTTDVNGTITDVSKAFCQVSGYTRQELVGQELRITRHPSCDDDRFSEMWEAIKTDRKWNGEIKHQRKDGEHYWLNTTVTPIFDKNGNKSGYTAISIDITNRKYIEELSIRDGLTGIYNRRYFNDTFSSYLDEARSKRRIVCLMIIDIDYFKQYNDTYGHQAGDEALVRISKSINASLKRQNDLCYRLGGEEFGVLATVNTPDDALHIAERIRKNVEALGIEHRGNDAADVETVSIGVVCQEAASIESSGALYKAADELLYDAKHHGRNRISHNLQP